MIKFFDAFNLTTLHQNIDRYFRDNPNLEIVTISHCQVARRGIFSPTKEWNAFVGYKIKETK